MKRFSTLNAFIKNQVGHTVIVKFTADLDDNSNDWLDENINGEFTSRILVNNRFEYRFEDAEDAMAFKLRWS